MSIYLVGHTSYLPDHFETEVLSELRDVSFVSGTLTPDRESPFFPGRSDEKIMRDDVKMSVVTVQKLLQQAELSNEEIADTALYVANGSFLGNFEKHMHRVLKVYQDLDASTPELVKRKKIYRVSPPLLALETLTNANMSFVAQYGGFKSNNTTIGNTSIGTYYALKQAFPNLKTEIRHTMICASNSAGAYSHMMNYCTLHLESVGKESAGGSNLLFESSVEPPKEAFCKITALKHNAIVPDLFQSTIDRNWKTLLDGSKADHILFSGAIDDATQETDRAYIRRLNNSCSSLYDQYGHLGAASIALGVIEGIRLLKEGKSIVDIVDRDIFGRESLVRIERC